MYNLTEFCKELSLGNSTVYQDTVEKDIASVKIFLQITSSVPTLLMAPIFGSWSDSAGMLFSELLMWQVVGQKLKHPESKQSIIGL